jgi:glycosyltransferase involved in cell wall biosynthesis
MTADDSVVYVVPDKYGGMMNIVNSLVAVRSPIMGCHVVLTDNRLSADTRFGRRLPADTQQTVRYALPTENLYAVLSRLYRAVPPGGGVLVANDLIELAMLHRYDPGRMVVQIVHGDYDYYYDLAARHQAIIDVFVAYSRRVADTLRERLPLRGNDVCYLPYGIPLPDAVRTPRPGPLRVVFVGRLDTAKGVHLLPAIDAEARTCGAMLEWTLIGDGPEGARLRESWLAPEVKWSGALDHDEVLRRLPQHDVCILPSVAEGLPLALVEAMGAGLVPVVTDLASGVPEIIEGPETGFRVPSGDIAAFARALVELHRTPDLLETMSHAARRAVATRFDPRTRTAGYEALYSQWRSRRRPRPPRIPLPYGSRLDHPWLPNLAVRGIRSAIRAYQGKPV